MIGAFDTKGPEYAFVREQILSRGHEVFTVNTGGMGSTDLFPVDVEQIEIVVHPQSIIHSMVAYVDGSVLAQMGLPDMRTPIAYALGWPQRMAAPAPRLKLAEIGDLTFEAPDEERFPAIRLARQALQCGGASPTVINAANEIAVHNFLNGRIDFLDIAKVVEETMGTVPNRQLESLTDVAEVDGAARETANSLISRSAVQAPHPA